MAGLYFHIPFCRRICAYCDFFKSAEVGRVDSVLDAMGRELDGAVDWLADRRIRTVYFGGGTPSYYGEKRLRELLDQDGNKLLTDLMNEQLLQFALEMEAMFLSTVDLCRELGQMVR